MKYFIIPVGFALIWWQPYIFIPVFIVLAAIAGVYEHKQEMAWFANLREHIYVVMDDPDTGKQYTVPGAEHLIFHAGERDMMKVVRQLEMKLKSSGNMFLSDPELKDHQRIKVIPIFYRSGKHINETAETFPERLRETIYNYRASWHETIAGSNYEYYIKYHHKNGSMGTTSFESQIKVD